MGGPTKETPHPSCKFAHLQNRCAEYLATSTILARRRIARCASQSVPAAWEPPAGARWPGMRGHFRVGGRTSRPTGLATAAPANLSGNAGRAAPLTVSATPNLFRSAPAVQPATSFWLCAVSPKGTPKEIRAPVGFRALQMIWAKKTHSAATPNVAGRWVPGGRPLPLGQKHPPPSAHLWRSVCWAFPPLSEPPPHPPRRTRNPGGGMGDRARRLAHLRVPWGYLLWWAKGETVGTSCGRANCAPGPSARLAEGGPEAERRRFRSGGLRRGTHNRSTFAKPRGNSGAALFRRHRCPRNDNSGRALGFAATGGVMAGIYCPPRTRRGFTHALARRHAARVLVVRARIAGWCNCESCKSAPCKCNSGRFANDAGANL